MIGPPPRRALLALAAALAAAGAPPAAGQDGGGERALLTKFDGTTLRARSATVNGAEVVLATASGSGKVPLSSVLSLEWDPLPRAPDDELPAAGPAPKGPGPVVVSMTDGDVVTGEIVRGEGESGFVVRTAYLGEVTVALDRVSTVAWPRAMERAEDPVSLRPAADADVFLIAGGDRVEGTLRSADATAVNVRTQGGVDRALPVASMMGFALAPLPAPPSKGLRVRLFLRDGCRVTAASVSGGLGEGLALEGVRGAGTRRLPADALAALTVSGGDGACLSDLPEASVEVRPFWPDDEGAWIPRPERDRAVHLDPGPPRALSVGGREYPRGLSMFSGTTMTWDLAGSGWRTFTAAVAVDDGGPKGDVEFEILVDGKSAWRSGAVGPRTAAGGPIPVPPVNVEGATTLALRVHAGPGDDVHDFADWLRPALAR